MCSVTAIRFIIFRPQSLKKKETGRNKLVSFWCHVFCFPDSFTHPRVKHAFNDPNKEEPAVVTTRYQNSPQNKGRRSTSEKTLLDRSRLGMKFCSDSEGLTALMDGCVGGACSGSAPRPRRPATHCHPRAPALLQLAASRGTRSKSPAGGGRARTPRCMGVPVRARRDGQYRAFSWGKVNEGSAACYNAWRRRCFHVCSFKIHRGPFSGFSFKGDVF